MLYVVRAGRTALHIAAATRQLAIGEALTAAGGDVSATDALGNGVIHYAVRRRGLLTAQRRTDCPGNFGSTVPRGTIGGGLGSPIGLSANSIATGSPLPTSAPGPSSPLPTSARAPSSPLLHICSGDQRMIAWVVRQGAELLAQASIARNAQLQLKAARRRFGHSSAKTIRPS